ncbi:MAG: DUF4386 domain-containing protein [Gammaproteobacteria bacterium]
MTNSVVETSPQTYARICGLLYLYIIVAASFGEMFVRGGLIVPLDATATANNIMASETLFRVALAGEMLNSVADAAVALFLYVLLAPVDRNLSLLAAFLRLAFVGIYSVIKLFEIAALIALDGEDYLNVFDPQQLHALAYMALRLHSYGFGASFLFFGFHCIVFGYLIRKSGFLPKFLGVLIVLGGVGYVVFSVAQMLAPAFAGKLLFPWVMLPAFFGELGLALWLTVKGVDVPKWRARARVT